MRLFRTQGYEATTVQQIIDEVEVSESTFFRYFPTKGHVVLTDDFDPIIVAAFQRQPPELTPIQALRRAFRRGVQRTGSPKRLRRADGSHAHDARGTRVARRDARAIGQPRCDSLTRSSPSALGGVLTTWRFGRCRGRWLALRWRQCSRSLEDTQADLSMILDETMSHLEGGLLL